MEQMEIIILDTDILIDYFRGVEVAKDYIERIPVNERATTDITLMELFKGARNKEELENVEKFIKRNIFIVLPVSSSASRRAVQILRRYSIQKWLSLPDALIAAVTISADGKLITGNTKHFEFIEGLKVDLPSYRRDILEE
jgi:tRNA(fMet)-specific endonuclease VapC